ncbi:hypothetical protein ABW19_dt0205130 [Dactylella cylindrospora]|nr:hypothetical protein ABW19_dt0205130 [Dactylella cylindrospora]
MKPLSPATCPATTVSELGTGSFMSSTAPMGFHAELQFNVAPSFAFLSIHIDLFNIFE